MKLVLETEETWIDNTKVVIKSLAFADTIRQTKLNEGNEARGKFLISVEDDEVVLRLSFN